MEYLPGNAYGECGDDEYVKWDTWRLARVTVGKGE